MLSNQVTTIIKGLTYNVPTFRLSENGLHQDPNGNLAIKFCNFKSGLKQEGVNPNHLLTVVSKYIKDEDFPHTENIVELLEETMNLIKAGQKQRSKDGKN